MHAPPDQHASVGPRGRIPARWRAAAAVTVAAALSLAAGTVPASAAGGYTVTATIGVGSSPDAVAADPAAGTIYVANFFDNTVSVIDAATGTVTATIGVGSSPEGVAVTPFTHTAYVANSGDGTVSVISAPRTPTALTAHIRRSPRLALTLTATLTASGRPLSGQPISFTTGHTHLCTRPTSTRGIATCVLTAAQARQAARHHGVIQATYPGNTSYQPSSATATPST
jgi:YVTN family beta-propeller protein